MPENSPFTRLADFDFSKETDEALVLLSKSGNALAIDVLIDRYRGFAKACSQAYFMVGADREDVIQEGMIGLYKAIVGFDAAKDVSFKTFAGLCIKRQIISAVKMSTRQKHLPLNSYVSLDADEGEVAGDGLGHLGETAGCDPERIVIDRETEAFAREQIEAALSPFEAEVLKHHLNGVPYGEIAVLLNREPKAVDNALQRIRHKVEKLLQ